MEEAKKICVYSGTAHPQLSHDIAEYLGVPLGKIHPMRFPDGETFVQFEENVRRADAFLIQPTCAPVNDNLMELLVMVDAARRASAARITAVLPYFGYARQDRKDKPRVPITAKLVANLLTVAGVDRIITMDLHSQQIQGFFDIPMDHLYARPVLVPYLKQLVGDDPVVVAPDSGSAKMAMNYGDMLGGGFAMIAAAFVLKIVFTALTLGAGFRGGEIVPVLFTGCAFGTWIGPMLGLPHGFSGALGMAAVFCGATNCPLSAMMLAYELFGGEGLPLYALCCGVSYMLSGYYGLYSEQKIIYSKFKTEWIDTKAK